MAGRMHTGIAVGLTKWKRVIRRRVLAPIALITCVIGFSSCSTSSTRIATPAARASTSSALVQSCHQAEPGEQASTTGPATPIPADDLSPLSDEFDQAGTLGQWQDLATEEGFPNKAAHLDINTTSPGQLYIEPYTSTWFDDYRGVFLYKEITGDYVASTRVRATGKGSATPTSTFSLSGLMSRAPRNITMSSWTPHGENWLFIATGYGDGRIDGPQFETKTTTNSASTLWLTPSQADWLNLRIVRIGEVFLLLYQFTGGRWTLSRCFDRPDLPQMLQVGVHAYTDWNTITTRYPDNPEEFNRTMLTGPDTHPDMIVRDEYVRFQRPGFQRAFKDKLAAGVATVEDVLNELN